MFLKVVALLFIYLLSSNSFANTKPHKIIFLGDSLTEGYGVPINNSFPKLIEKTLKTKHKKLTIVNAGSSGSTSASAVKRVKWLIKSKPTVLFIALGANDGLRGLNLEQTEKNLQEAINLAIKNNIKVILAGVRIPLNYGVKYRKQFENLYKNLAKKNPVTFIPYLLKNVAGIKELNQSDRIHPNEKGHEVISQTVLPYIEKLL